MFEVKRLSPNNQEVFPSALACSTLIMYIHLMRGRGMHSRSDASQSAELSKRNADEQAGYIQMKMSKKCNFKNQMARVAEMLVILQTYRAD